MKSVFIEKAIRPSDAQLRQALGATYSIWKNIETYCLKVCPVAEAGWHYSGEKFGWSFRIKDKKRVLVYLLPRDQYFKCAFVFSEKATNQILGSDISPTILAELTQAKPYAEGRGIRIDIREDTLLSDIHQLILIKLAH